MTMTINNNLLLMSLALVSCSQQISEMPPAPVQSDPNTIAPPLPSGAGCVAQIRSDYFSPDSVAIISGNIDPENNLGEFESIYIVEPGQVTASSGPFMLQLEDVSGNKLASFCFDVLWSQGDSPFIAVIPWSVNVSRIVLLKDDIQLAERSKSANPPVVRVISPNGGENITADDEMIQWEASDPDGDDLTYVVSASDDDGETWTSLGIDLTGTSIKFLASSLNNTHNGRVRVLASDGFFTSQDISDAPFVITTLEGSSLYVDIFEEGGVFSGDQTVILEGEAYSNTGSVSQDEVAFTWSSDIDGVLAEGSSLAINAMELSEGTHTITLSAEYEGLDPGSDSIEITIYREFSSLSVEVTELNFKARLGDPAVMDKAVDIWHLGNHSVSWSATADQDWIVLRAMGTVTPEYLLVAVNLTDLPVGVYTGKILIKSDAEGVSTHTITVTLEITK